MSNPQDINKQYKGIQFALVPHNSVYFRPNDEYTQYYSTYTETYLEVNLCVTVYDFSPMDLNSPCALLQTQLKGGPLGSFLMQSRNKPLQILGMLAGGIGLLVVVTVIISTATFLRNKKSNRILPNRRVRRRQQKQAWTFKNPFKKRETPAEKFRVEEEEQEPEVTVENVNYNNNVSNVVRQWPPPPPPPRAPSLPPPPPPYIPGERQWTVPTVSATVPPKPKKKPVVTRQDTVNKALVSELKLRLEQKRMMKHH